MIKKFLYFCIPIIIIAILYYLISPIWNVIEVNEGTPDFQKMNPSLEDTAVNNQQIASTTQLTAHILAQANFIEQAHEVKGQALLLQDAEQQILRFENFETINGPNLHIYLSADLDATDYIDLGEIKATKGNINYSLPQNIDSKKYKHVLVWCKPFKVLFSSASLQ